MVHETGDECAVIAVGGERAMTAGSGETATGNGIPGRPSEEWRRGSSRRFWLAVLLTTLWAEMAIALAFAHNRLTDILSAASLFGMPLAALVLLFGPKRIRRLRPYEWYGAVLMSALLLALLPMFVVFTISTVDFRGMILILYMATIGPLLLRLALSIFKETHSRP